MGGFGRVWEELGGIGEGLGAWDGGFGVQGLGSGTSQHQNKHTHTHTHTRLSPSSGLSRTLFNTLLSLLLLLCHAVLFSL